MAKQKKEIKEKAIEVTLRKAANKLRGSVEPAEYKHVVLGLIFLKFANDKFEEHRAKLIDDGKEKYIEMPEFYNMNNVFFLEETSRWSYLIKKSKQNDISLLIDTALHTIEKNNKALKGALPYNYFSRLDLRQIGIPFEKKYTQFSEQHIKDIGKTYHTWQVTTMIDEKLLRLNEKTKKNIYNSSLTINHYKESPEFCYSATLEEVVKKDFSLVPSKYIEFVNRDENIDFDEKMQTPKTEFADLLKAEAQSKNDLLSVFKELGYEIG